MALISAKPHAGEEEPSTTVTHLTLGLQISKSPSFAVLGTFCTCIF
jgi:hypothetical protein